MSTAVPPNDQRVLFRRPVVLGGSIAGLMAARVDAALAAGAVTPPPKTHRFYVDGELRHDPPTGPAAQGLISSRPFLEALIRHRVLGRGNVRTVRGRAEGLRITDGAVTGVRWVTAGSEEVTEEPADFVVDAGACA